MKSIKEHISYYNEESFRNSLESDNILSDLYFYKLERNISIYDGKIIRCDGIVIEKSFKYWGICELKILKSWEYNDILNQMITYSQLINDFTYYQEKFNQIKIKIFNDLKTVLKNESQMLIRHNKPYLFLINDVTQAQTISYETIFKLNFYNVINIQKFRINDSPETYFKESGYLQPEIQQKSLDVRIASQCFTLLNPSILGINLSDTKEFKLRYQNNILNCSMHMTPKGSEHVLIRVFIKGYGIKDGFYRLTKTNDEIWLYSN